MHDIPSASGLDRTQIAGRAPHLLVVEDDPNVAEALRGGLDGEGYDVVLESNGHDALLRARGGGFDLILLDLGLPGTDGLSVIATLRAHADPTPIIVLTARDAVRDRVTGLEAGADDYLAKPFAFSELLARVRAILRRGRSVTKGPFVVGDVVLDPATRRVQCAGKTVALTAKEFDLLEYLARAEGQVVSREALARDVWRESSRSSTLDNIIDVHVSRLRRKLGHQTGGHQHLHTIRGVGFALRETAP